VFTSDVLSPEARSVGECTYSEGGLDITHSSGLEGDQLTGQCGTARLGGQVCARETVVSVSEYGKFTLERYYFIYIQYKELFKEILRAIPRVRRSGLLG